MRFFSSVRVVGLCPYVFRPNRLQSIANADIKPLGKKNPVTGIR
jgi:hypothetical protein